MAAIFAGSLAGSACGSPGNRKGNGGSGMGGLTDRSDIAENG